MLYDQDNLVDLSEAFAFIGNSLLSPLSKTEREGIDPGFWGVFPDFGNSDLRYAIDACKEYAVSAQELSRAGGDPVRRASVEYTKLFVGPPCPAAAPWETYYSGDSTHSPVGFGQSTFEMQSLLLDEGLEVSGSNNQYADHMGIELLLLSVLLKRAASEKVNVARLADFAKSHPAAWIHKLSGKVTESAPDGYYARLLQLATCLLRLIA